MYSILRPLLLKMWDHLNSLGCETDGQPHLHPDIKGHAQSLRQLLPELLRTYRVDNDIESFLLTLKSRRAILAGHDLLALSSLANTALRTRA